MIKNGWLWLSMGLVAQVGGGCIKENVSLPKTDTLLDETSSRFPRPRVRTLPVLSQNCVYSYSELVQQLGGINHFAVSMVELEDVTQVRPIWPIGYMQYKAVEASEEHSLFRCELAVWHRSFGMEAIADYNSWSLGCVYSDARVPPFTNLIKDGDTFLIHASMTWALPPHMGKRVIYLNVE